MVFNANAGGFDLGSAYGQIIIDGSDIDRGVGQAQRAFDSAISGFGAGLDKLGSQLSKFGASLTLLTTPIAAFGAQGVAAASSFEDALKAIEVRAGLTGDEMDTIRQKALQLGADTTFSAGQAADAFLQLLTSGQSVTEVMQTIDAVMAGAAASGDELGYVADAITDIMAAFNLRAEESVGVVQALTDASGASSATFSSLTQGFQNVGGAAHQFGLTVFDTAAILATFSENGIKGAEAGTQLRSMLRNMTADTDRVQNTWAKLGISMFDANQQIRPLADVMDELRQALAGMTDQERIETIQNLGGAYGQLGLTALTSGGNMRDMEAAMADGADVADIAAARMDTFSGAVEYLRGSLETLQINTLTPFMNDVLRPMVQRLGDVVNQINAWATANPELASRIIGVLSLLVGAGPVLFAVGKAISLIGIGFQTLAPILGVIISPLGAVVAAVTGITAALDALGIIDVEAIFNSLRIAFEGFIADLTAGGSLQGAVLNALTALFGPELGAQLGKAFNEMFGPAIQWVVHAVDAFNRFVGAIQAGVDPIQAALTLIGDLFGTEFQAGVVRILGELTIGFQNAANAARQLVFLGLALLAAASLAAQQAIHVFVTEVASAITNTTQWISDNAGLVLGIGGLVVALISAGVHTKILSGLMVILRGVIAVGNAIWAGFNVLLAGIVTKLGLAQTAAVGLASKMLLAVGPILAVGLAIAGVIKQIEEFNRLVSSAAQAAGRSLAPAIRGGLTRQQIEQELFRQMQEQFGDFGARLIFGSGTINIQGKIDELMEAANATPYDTGGRIRAGDIALIGKGAQPEAFIAPTNGYMIPNADKLMGGDTINVAVYANSAAEGAAAAEAFDRRLKQLRRSRG